MNTSEHQVQVDTSHYFSSKYASLDRFISYFYQIDHIRNLHPKRLLFIGVGDGLVSDYIAKHAGIEIVTYDFDARLNPTVVGDVRSLPFPDNSFDAVVAFEVLEHIPLADAQIAVAEIARVTSKTFIMSVPYRRAGFEWILRFPGIRSLCKRDFLRVALMFPLVFGGFAESGQHYWETDARQFSAKKIRTMLRQWFTITREFTAPLDYYRWFITMEKKAEVLTHNYVKEYYNQSVGNLTGDYESTRWFNSPEARFDYEQTKYSIETALAGVVAADALEIGPGDAVWTPLVLAKTKHLDMVEQSEEMAKKAVAKLPTDAPITMHVTDILTWDTTKNFDLIFASRCFEYFSDKPAAMKKFVQWLRPHGRLVIITKNPAYTSLRGKTKKLLHREQATRAEMIALGEAAGLTLVSATPATYRWLSSFRFFRMIFSALQKVAIAYPKLRVPGLDPKAVESYTYIFTRS